MTTHPRASKRAKTCASSASAITSLFNTSFDANNVTKAKVHAKMSFRCPVTIDNVFRAPEMEHVQMFFRSRHNTDESFQQLSKIEKLAWIESFTDNKTLMGFTIYAMLFPKLLQTRVKLNADTYHWAHLDASSEKGRAKLEQRLSAINRLKSDGFTRSVFKGLPYTIDASVGILKYMKMEVDEEDERFRFFANREFSMIHSKRGEVGSSSVYSSCSMALSLLWFATTVLARPCCLESIVFPLTVAERQKLERKFECPSQFFDGTIRGFDTNWGNVFAAIGTHHRNIDYTLLEEVSGQKYVEGVHVADAYAVFRATMTAPGDLDTICSLVESYQKHSKHGVESGAIVGALDVVRDKPIESIGRIDGSVLGSIHLTYGERACLLVQEECNKRPTGVSMFDTSVTNKLVEILAHFDAELWKARKRDKVKRIVASNMDPAGMNRKIEGGKMLDPTDANAVKRMMDMLKALSAQVWKPLKTVVGKALGTSLEFSPAFLRISETEAEQVYKCAVSSGVSHTDIANLCTLLLLSFSFQRSQVLREATIDEFQFLPDTNCYKFVLKNRRFKTASSAAKTSTSPLSHFTLSPEQSMIIKFIGAVGHRFSKRDNHSFEANRRLFINAKGEHWTQKDVAVRFKLVGRQWLGIENFSPHISRTFWATHALNSGQISGANIEDFSSFLQVSASTLRNSYMAASANSPAQDIGNEVLGSVVNAACTGAATQQEARPYGKKLSARRIEFMQEIRASLLIYAGDSKRLFRDLLRKRNSCQLSECESWFRWENTFFSDSDERFFQRFVDRAGP